MGKRLLIVIAGPTASGKTDLAIALATYLNTEIVSADSRQCFRELNIGVAKPSGGDLRAVRHHFINSHSIADEVNAGVYERYALDVLDKIFLNKQVAVLAGGTGLYIDAVCNGIDPLPEIPASVRAHIQNNYETNGLQWLQRNLQEKDPDYFKIIDQQNPQRLMRALEVAEQTGKSIQHFRSHQKVSRNFEVLKIAMDLPREQLYGRINRRVDEMMTQGLLEEVKTLQAFRNLNALQTVGYKELFTFLEGKQTLPEAVEEIKKHTRHYAKRQLTWFKKNKDYHWVSPHPISSAIALISKHLN